MTAILVLSDERDERLLGGAVFGGELSSLEWLSDLEAGRRALESGQHDAYLVDAFFAAGRGVALAQAAARRGSRPVILLVRRPDPVFEAKVLARGVSDVLVYSELTPTSLERAVAHAIARSAREQRHARPDEVAPTVGLPALTFRLENATTRARRGLGGAALLAIRCDPGSELTDPGMLALLSGDALERVRSSVREIDTICRAQSTFFVLMEDRDPRFLAANAADRILSELEMPFTLRGRTLKVAASIGVAVFPEDGKDAEALFNSAQRALSAAVNAGGHGFQYPTHPETNLATRRIALERVLERAVEREEFSLQYQPQVDLETNSVVGVEALLRWHDKDLGEVEPGEFVPLLEAADLIDDVGEWVLRRACAQAKAWADRGRRLKMSVNVSARQFSLGDVAGIVRSALHETRLDPRLLTLELTEGVMLDSTPDVLGTLNRIRELGVRIAVDDFGTGYASLRYVKHFPMDIVKIDKEFVRGLPLNTANGAITNAIASLARSLGLEVVAEGVETEAEAEFLRDLRCTIVQGHLHARAMNADDFEAYHDALRARQTAQ